MITKAKWKIFIRIFFWVIAFCTMRTWFCSQKLFLYVCKCKTTQLNSVTKQVRNRNNGFISYIKVFRNKDFIFLFSIFWVDVLDTDRSYLVNFLYFYFLNQPLPFYPFFCAPSGFLSYNVMINVMRTFLSFFVTHFWSS